MPDSTSALGELAAKIDTTERAFLQLTRQVWHGDIPPGLTPLSIAFLELAIDECLATFNDPAEAFRFIQEVFLRAQPQPKGTPQYQ